MPDLSPAAKQVCELLEDANRLMGRGEPGWQCALDAARQIADQITDPVSADDARTRLAILDAQVSQSNGDLEQSLNQIDLALAAIARQRVRLPDEQTRLNDHEWTALLNRCQVLQAMGDVSAATAVADQCLELAAASLDPIRNTLATLNTVAGLALSAEDYPRAVLLYTQLVDQSRRHSLDDLLWPLVGLAQSQYLLGELAGARHTAARALAICAGDVTAQANLAQLLGLIELAQGNSGAAAHHLSAFAQQCANPDFLLDPRQQLEAAKAEAIMSHNAGHCSSARSQYDAAVDQARKGPDPAALIGALIQLSGATQDCALVGETADREATHQAALSQLDEARNIAVRLARPLITARIDVLYAKYLNQWQELLAPSVRDSLREPLEKCLPAVVFFHAFRLTADSSDARDALARQYGQEATELAMSLAFALGDKLTVAEIIELCSASAQFAPAEQVTDMADLPAISGNSPEEPRLVMSAQLAWPLLLDQRRLVLAEAAAKAHQRYGLELPVSAPIPTW